MSDSLVITRLEALDIRFPTSRELDGSDAMNPDPDYSARVRDPAHRATRRLKGMASRSRSARGDEICVAAIEALAPLVVGADVDAAIRPTWAAFWRRLDGDSQFRWLGPEKGVMHMATAAVVNAVWDLGPSARASRSGSCSPGCRRSSSWRWSTSATSPTR